MKNKNLLYLAVVVLINSVCFGQWISLDKNSVPDSKPNVQLISDDITGTVIKVELTGFRIKEFSAGGKVYQSIDLGSLGITSEVGMPDIPYIAKILAIPDQGTIDVEVLETSKPQIIEGINLPPVRESWSEGKPETPYVENIKVYGSELTYPEEFVKVEDPAIFRDFRIARVSIFPIRYSPAKQEIEVVSSITIRIKYGGGLGINPKLTSKKPIAPSFAKIYKSVIFNYKEVLQREYNGQLLGYDLMLCIMPDSFATSFQPYADWNHKTGTYIHITKFSEIGASGSNPTPIRDYILTAYTTWAIPPTHILLVGDAGVAPVKNITLDGWTFVYDDYFVELVGNDFFPEMMIGRFTNQNNVKLRVFRNKLIAYERNPNTVETTWYKKGLVCADSEYPSMRETKRFTAHEMLQFGNFSSVDSVWDGYPCNGNVTTIVNMINAGRSFLNYRGQGWYSGWNPSANCIAFQTSDVNNLNNTNKLTFVTSIGCGVANFAADGGNCFGEAWVKLGDETTYKGACAFLGPTSNTHTAYNNQIDIGIYQGMFEEGLDSPGEALLRGKFHMYEVFGGSDPYVNYHYKIYHVLGDPSLHIWKDIPRNITVSYTDTIAPGTNQVQVIVHESSSGLPVQNALVCISGNNVYAVGTTLANGTAILDVNALTIGALNITVSGGNVIPFEGTIQVIEGVNTFQLSVSINNGWNLVSIPGLHPVNQNVLTWWSGKDPLADVFKYGSIGYIAISTATPSEGYWMKHLGANVYNTGDEWPAGGIQIVPHNPINAFIGWNLIGGYENIVATSDLTTTPPGLISGPIYEYSNGYQVAANLNPGYGYWIKLSGAGQINIPGSFAKGKLMEEYFPKDWGRITLTDAAGVSYTLYAVKGEVNLSQYELPPAPPTGMFDIRFESGRIAEDINSSMKTIDMSGITYPLTVKVEGMNIRLQDETGKTVNANLKSGQDIVISDATINKLMVTGELIPTVYALEQNYPNPFNPSTTIEFSLPENVSNVKLSIYNTLGEKVAELVNSSLQAGRYSYQWNAQNVATGMYIYELRTDKFISSKKMMILK
jgi:hypothetical protein